VGLSAVSALGAAVRAGEALALVHAADADAAAQAVRAVQAAMHISDSAPAALPPVLETIT
jgi:thymidine phosphorylase